MSVEPYSLLCADSLTRQVSVICLQDVCTWFSLFLYAKVSMNCDRKVCFFDIQGISVIKSKYIVDFEYD